MISITSIGVIIKLLDFIHDSLHPFFKDEPDNKDLEIILKKLESIEKEVKDAKEKNKD